MKNILFIFIVLIMVSCKNESVKNSNEMELEYATEDAEMDITVKETFMLEQTQPDFKTETFDHKELTTEKLQELYDVLMLIQKHPEFKESLTSQLNTYTKDSLTAIINKDIVVDNLRLKGNILKPNDSTQKMKLLYNKTSQNNRTLDSIWAKITFKTVTIDGKEMQSKKIKFEKIK